MTSALVTVSVFYLVLGTVFTIGLARFCRLQYNEEMPFYQMVFTVVVWLPLAIWAWFSSNNE